MPRGNPLDLLGQRFGKLLVIAPAPSIRIGNRNNTYTRWFCRCDCGKEKIIRTTNLRSGHAQSCACGTINQKGYCKITRLDLAGQRFGKLTVIERVESKNKNTRWLCHCDCGTEKIVLTSYLRAGYTRSCGCWQIETTRARSVTHGKSRTPEYRCWSGMINRCRNPNVSYFMAYGGRGIRVCDRWLDFENFLADMGTRPSLKHSIDRIDVNGPYSPENCRWATQRMQSLNRRPIPKKMPWQCNVHPLTHGPEFLNALMILVERSVS